MTKLCFIDTETTSLRPDRRIWEVGLIVRDADDASPGTSYVENEYHWFIDQCDLDLGNADLFSLKVGKFHDRHPSVSYADNPNWCIENAALVRPEPYVLHEVERLTRGAHLVGAVVSFDAEVLAARMREHHICPSWHYHLIDVEALTVGYLNGRRARQNEIVDGYPLENHGEEAPGLVRWNKSEHDVALPWKSDDLSAALGIETPVEDRHTALGDAKWARAIYDAVMA